MSPTLRHLPARSMSGAPAHLRYLEGDPDLEAFLGSRPRDVTDLLSRAPVAEERQLDHALLAEALTSYAARHEAPEEVRQRAAEVATGKVRFIVTGQQPGLFGGPLFTVHKVATAVRLAEAINATDPGFTAVPLFWNHTDDHDLDEVNRAFFVNQSLEVQRIRLDLQHTGEAIRNIAIGTDLDHALAAVQDLLTTSEFRSWAVELFRPRTKEEHFGDGAARMLFGLFGSRGLQIIEPRDLPEPAFAMLPDWWNRANEILGTISSTLEVLQELGLDISVDPSSTLMFQMHGPTRSAMAQGDPIERATALSPGALLRPLWQDAVLPNLASIVGPGELAYLAVAGPLYRQLQVPAPVFVPRASLTLVEPSLAKLLDRFGWDVPDLEAGVDKLAADALPSDDGNEEAGLEALVAHVEAEMRSLVQTTRANDPQMVRGVDRTRAKVGEELTKLLTKLRNSRQNRQGTGARQIRRVVSSLRPKGRPQERILTAMPFLTAHGPGFADALIDAADPFHDGHGVLEL